MVTFCVVKIVTTLFTILLLASSGLFRIAMELKFLLNSLFISFRGLLWICTEVSVAEKAGFEPAVRFEPYTRFPGVHLKPLGHFSNQYLDRGQRIN